jgi:hypothetical protein
MYYGKIQIVGYRKIANIQKMAKIQTIGKRCMEQSSSIDFLITQKLIHEI